jgi:hypothetical protein
VTRCRFPPLIAVATALVATLGTATPAAADSSDLAQAEDFAQADDAAITPGVLMRTPVDENITSQCTAAFVFRGDDATYLGYAAHCAAQGEPMGLSGCVEPALPLGTAVEIEGNDGSSTSGRLAYTSWGTMQDEGESDEALCLSNDFALVELDPADVARANPSVPVLGGPTGLDTDGTVAGEQVLGYQPTQGGGTIRQGRSLGVSRGGRTHHVDTVPPGRPGDSGSGYLDADGDAFGVLSTLTLNGQPTNGLTDLANALDYANDHGGIGRLALVRGTEPFQPRVLSRSD